MTQREFLKVFLGGILASCAGCFLAACKGSTTPDSATPSTPSTPSSSQDSKAFTSSSEPGHYHTISMAKAEIDAPPAGGISRQTSDASDIYAGSHTHSFTMAQADLMSVQGGKPATVTTGATNSHTHTFAIQKWY